MNTPLRPRTIILILIAFALGVYYYYHRKSEQRENYERIVEKARQQQQEWERELRTQQSGQQKPTTPESAPLPNP